MIKAKVLIEKKDSLMTQLREIEQAIAEQTRKLDDENLNKFIKEGVLKSEDGYQIQRLRKQKNSLLAVQKGLDRSIYISRQKEREKEAEKIKNRKQNIEKQKGKVLYQLRKKLDQVKQLEAENKKFFDPIMEIDQELKEAQNPQEVDNFKLVEVEDFLKRHYIKYPEKVREMVKQTIADNREAFSPGVKPLGHGRSQVYGGFMATIQKDSGICELKHPENSGWSVDLAAHNEIAKAACLGQEVKK